MTLVFQTDFCTLTRDSDYDSSTNGPYIGYAICLLVIRIARRALRIGLVALKSTFIIGSLMLVSVLMGVFTIPVSVLGLIVFAGNHMLIPLRVLFVGEFHKNADYSRTIAAVMSITEIVTMFAFPAMFIVNTTSQASMEPGRYQYAEWRVGVDMALSCVLALIIGAKKSVFNTHLLSIKYYLILVSAGSSFIGSVLYWVLPFMRTQYMGMHLLAVFGISRFFLLYAFVKDRIITSQIYEGYFSPTTVKSILMASRLLCYWLSFSGLLHVVLHIFYVPLRPNFSFWDSMFYVVLCLINGPTTEIIADVTAARIIVLLIIILLLFILPKEISKMTEVYKAQPIHSQYEQKMLAYDSIVIISGILLRRNVMSVLSNLKREKPSQNIDVLLVDDGRQNAEVVGLTSLSRIHRKMRVSFLNTISFRKAQSLVEKYTSINIYVINDYDFGIDPELKDCQCIATARFFHGIFQRFTKDFNIHLQVILRTSIPLTYGIPCCQAVCLDQLLVNYMAQSTAATGLATLCEHVVSDRLRRLIKIVSRNRAKFPKKPLNPIIECLSQFEWLERIAMTYAEQIVNRHARRVYNESGYILLGTYKLQGGLDPYQHINFQGCGVAILNKLDEEEGFSQNFALENLGGTRQRHFHKTYHYVDPKDLESQPTPMPFKVVYRHHFPSQSNYFAAFDHLSDVCCEGPQAPAVGHVLICDFTRFTTRLLVPLVEQLKNAHNDPDLAIVVTSDSCLPPNERALLERYRNVYYVPGNPAHPGTLHRANVMGAIKAIVLHNPNPDPNENITVIKPICHVMTVIDYIHSINPAIPIIRRLPFSTLETTKYNGGQQGDYIFGLVDDEIPPLLSGEAIFTDSFYHDTRTLLHYDRFSFQAKLLHSTATLIHTETRRQFFKDDDQDATTLGAPTPANSPAETIPASPVPELANGTLIATDGRQPGVNIVNQLAESASYWYTLALNDVLVLDNNFDEFLDFSALFNALLDFNVTAVGLYRLLDLAHPAYGRFVQPCPINEYLHFTDHVIVLIPRQLDRNTLRISLDRLMAHRGRYASL
ncbi:hypothetical protein H4R34_002027 [Dimargaris verticillata]|uniref:RCK N-terminal domain-containing protein n=1 Tax=Dimargaris verticillata TaxID=2761393 RepID=A0A9W8B8V0_9FUNG|nr:hypothetical protein H4R34_002027 [Dimargaris verticillata]